jgi:hypothetical protein
MADNVAITAGTGTSIATDDVGGVHVQFVKLYDGTDGSTTPVVWNANRGFRVVETAINRFSVTPTISASAAYTSGDAIGGLLTFANVARFSGGGARLKQVLIVDKDAARAPLDLVLFDRTFTNTADNAAFDPTDADLANVVAVVPIGTYANFNDKALGYSLQLDLPLLLNGTSLFGQLVMRGEPTYTTTSALIVILSILQE